MQSTIFSRFVVVVGVGFVAACSSADSESTGSSGAASLGSPGIPNAADHGCNVVLRDISVPRNRGGVETNCTGTPLTCWLVLEGDLDVSMAAVNEGDAPYVFYQAGSNPSWFAAPTTPITGAGQGMQRYSFQLDHDTAIFDQPWPTLQVIPYLQTTAGTRLFDHNEFAANYVLNSDNDWSVHPNGEACYDAPATGSASVVFASGWTQTAQGNFTPGGKLDVTYDLNRMPQCFNASTDGVAAWNTEAYELFTPGNQLIQRSVRGTRDPATQVWQSLLFENDIPNDATSVALWFETSGDGCTTSWDSDYGQNYNFAITKP